MAEHRDRREALIRAAFSAIAEQGFEGFRLRPIAASAGIDHSTLHHYFPTKADLIAAVLEHMTSQFEATMRTELKPAARLRHHLSEIAKAMTERPELFIVLEELDLRGLRDESTAASIRNDEMGWREALATVFEEGIAQRVWPANLDIDASVELVIAAIKGVRLRPDLAESVLGQLCDLFLLESDS